MLKVLGKLTITKPKEAYTFQKVYPNNNSPAII